MSKQSPQKQRVPQQSQLPQDRTPIEKAFNSFSTPRREMIMPREFNTVSDPKTRTQTSGQISTTLSSDWGY